MKLRNYQRECIEKIMKKPHGRYLIQMATGLGKTVTFAQLQYKFDRILILSHRKELVEQPLKYFNCNTGIEQGKNKSFGEKIISASVQTLVKRLNKFEKDYFDVIIVDEAHHTPAPSYKKILDYFTPKYVLGFTATPNRGDKVGLEDCYQEIIFQKNLIDGIKEGYLCNIECKRVNISFDLSKVKLQGGDFKQNQLDEAVNIEEANKAIAKVVEDIAVGQTIVFAVSVNHCHELQKLIPSSKVIDGKTSSEERTQIIKDFTNKKFKVLINCMVFTEGTDLPLIQTVIIARPTKNESLYTQMVGRGLRLHPDKEKLLLIDCVGVSNNSICTAPTLIGLHMENIPKSTENEIEGDLFDLEGLIEIQTNNPESWIKNIKNVDIWKKVNKYETHGVSYFQTANGDLHFYCPGIPRFIIKKPDELGFTTWKNEKKHIQTVFDNAFVYLRDNHNDKSLLWDTNKMKKWGTKKPSEYQIKKIENKLPFFDYSEINRIEASQLIKRLEI